MLPGIAKQKIQEAVRQNCASCFLIIGDVNFHLLDPGRVGLLNLHFRSGKTEATLVEAYVSRLTLHLDLRALLSHEVHIPLMEVVHPRISVTNGEGKSPPSHDSGESDSDWKLQLDRLNLNRGLFEYVRNLKGTHAAIHVANIRGSVQHVSTDGIRTALADVACQIEGSGAINLKVEVNPFKKPLHVKLDLNVRDQNLEGLSRFFKPNDGVDLKGILLKARGHVDMTGPHLTSEVWAEYKDLEVKLDKAYDRSSTAAFFMSLGANLVMQKKNVGAKPSAQVRAIESDREADDTVVSFILQGLKKAALKVAEAPQS